MLFSKLNKNNLLKIFSLFSVVRGYNILFIILAQFICATFIFSRNLNINLVLYDVNIWLIIFCSAFSISAGYIVNSIYDAKKDLINRPLKTTLENQISGKTKFTVYILFNLLTLFFASLVSVKAFLFFGIYILAIIIYSIKISKYPFVGNIFSVLLSVTPFFAIMLYYKNYSEEIISHSIFLFFVVLTREVVKDLESFVGDFTLKYITIPVKYGERISKWYITLCSLFILILSAHILNSYQISLMKYYFYFTNLFYIGFLFFLWKSKSRLSYQKLHNSLKFLIIIGILSITLHDF